MVLMQVPGMLQGFVPDCAGAYQTGLWQGFVLAVITIIIGFVLSQLRRRG